MTHFIIETRPVKHDKNLLTPLHSAASAATTGEAGEISSQQRGRHELVRLSLRGPEVPYWAPKGGAEDRQNGIQLGLCFEEKGQNEARLRPQKGKGKKTQQFYQAKNKCQMHGW